MKKIIILIILFAFQGTNAQLFSGYKVIDEYEASIGYLNVQGDFGVRNRFDTTLGSSGATAGAKAYINFNDPYDYSRTYLGKHLKYNIAFDMGYSGLSHRNYPNPNNSLSILKIEAITGQFYYFDLGINMEYHISDLRSFNFFSSSFFTKFDPYVGGGVYGFFYNVELESSLGNMEKTPSIIPDPYVGGINNGTGTALGFHIETGIRYRLSDDLLFNLKSDWMYFLKDDIDGLSPNPDMAENLYNDWLLKTQFGIVIFIQ